MINLLPSKQIKRKQIKRSEADKGVTLIYLLLFEHLAQISVTFNGPLETVDVTV